MNVDVKTPHLRLWSDRFTVMRSPEYLIERAKVLRPILERPEYRTALNANEAGRALYTELRYQLLILSKSSVSTSRRLTWRERITGRARV